MTPFGAGKQYSLWFFGTFGVGKQYSYDFLEPFGVGKQFSYDFWHLLEAENNTVMIFETLRSIKTIQLWFVTPFGVGK